MAFNSSSVAAANVVGFQGVSYAPSSSVKPRRILVTGTYDHTITGITANVPVRVLNDTEVGQKYGYGHLLHRMAKACWKGSHGVEMWVYPQAEAGGAAAATGTLTYAGSSTAAGTIYLYVGNDLVEVPIPTNTAAAAVGPLVVAAVNAVTDLPVVASGPAAVVTMTAKSSGTTGNFISLSHNRLLGQSLPSGITCVIVAMATGATDPTFTCSGLGAYDGANELDFTAVVNAYHANVTTAATISTYNGPGADFLGNYAKEIARPFRSLDGDTTAGSGGLTAILAVAAGVPTDRTTGYISAPGAPIHPAELAAQAIGVMERIAADRPEQSYIGQVLEGVIPGAQVDRWTDDYDNRDAAARLGVSPTHVINGVLAMQDTLTPYLYATQLDNNVWRDQRNIAIVQNMLRDIKNNFGQEKWLGITVVDDVAKVTNPLHREKVRDRDSVIDDLVKIVKQWEGRAYIYTADFTTDRLAADASLVTIRSGGRGFNINLPVILSGNGGIINTTVQGDISLAVLGL